MKTRIKIRLVGSSAPVEIIEKGDWIDLRVAETVTFKAPEARMLKRDRVAGHPEGEGRRKVEFDNKLLSLGVAMELPKGYEAWVISRSSGPDKNGIELRNSFGLIDNTYCGNEDIWKFAARGMRDVTLEAGTRIAQFRISLSQKATVWQKLKWLFSNGVTIEFVDHLNGKNRGGHGSTGTK